MILFGNYRIANVLTGATQILDGKLLKVRIDDHNQIDFIDAITGDTLRQTTPIVEMSGVINNTADLILKTSSGNVYHICSIAENGLFTSPMTPIESDIEVVTKFVKKLSTECADAMNALKRVGEYTANMTASAPHANFEADAIIDELFPEDLESVQDELPNEFNEHPFKSNDGLPDALKRAIASREEQPQVKVPEPKEEEIDISDLPGVVQEESLPWKHINYGDGWGPVHKVIFNEEITQEQFIRYCKYKGWNMTRINGWAWYEDHAYVHNSHWNQHMGFNPNHKWESDRTWIYKWVRVYTD